MIVSLSRNWWLLAIRGVTAMLFGAAVFLWPVLTLGVLVRLFGAYALLDGIFAVMAGISAQKGQERWWMMVLEGLAGIGIGVLAFVWSGITALVLLYIIAAWLFVTGAFEIAAAIRLRQEIESEWLLLLTGGTSILCGILLMILTVPGALPLAWLIGTYALVFGVLLLGLALRVRDRRDTAGRQVSGAV